MTYISDAGYSTLSTNNSTTADVGGSTTLGAEATQAATTITVSSTAQFPTTGTIKIVSGNGTEYITYTGKTTSPDTFTGCTRGSFNTTDVTHANGSTVIGVYIGTSEQSPQPDVMVSLKSDTAGTEYFDFSNDNTNWDTFPVSGFTVTANIHEFHTAVKGFRYFRIRFENGSSSATTSFRISTYYGIFRQGNLPLNQSIGDDADSVIVRAVGTGADPNGTYINNPVSGIDNDNSTTTTNTALNDANDISDSDTTIEVDSSTGFSDGDYFRIGNEIIKIGTISSTTWSSCTRAQLGTTATSHSDNDAIYRIQVLASTAIDDVGNINATVTTITVDSTTDFASSGTIIIEDELITYTGTTATSFTGCTRGAYETTAAAHNDNTVIGASFVGPYTDISQFIGISVLIDGNATAAATGKLQMHFSHDGEKIHRNISITTTDIASTAPRTLGTVASYFRIIYSNTSSITCSLEAQTMYHMQQVQLVGRLDQAIGESSDVSLVRSVQAGKKPDGTFSNTLQDGSAFRTTDNLGGTLINNVGGYTSGETTSIIVDDTSSFGDSGHIYIGSEFIAYASKTGTTFDTLTRGEFGTTAAAISDNDVVGEAYNSGVLTLDGYTEVATKLLCSTTGQNRFQWYSDSAGADPIRTLSPSYPPAGGTVGSYDYLAAPNFGPYVRYVFANTDSGGAATTDFYFETEFYTKSISAQVLTVNSTILGAMTTNLTRSIIAGQDKSGNFKNGPVDSEGHIMTHIHDPTSAFGQIKTAEETTIIQISFPYIISSLKLNTYSLITDVSTTGGTGSSLTVDYTTSSGALVDIFPRDRGSSYVVGDTITISGGTSGTGDVEAVDSSGGVLAISLNAAGSGYTDTTSTATQENNMLKLTTQASANRRILVKTKRKAKYQTGTGIVCRFTGVYATGATGLNQYIGIGDENNGFFVGYQGTTFGILIRKNGTETWTASTSFNVDLLDGTGTNNPSNININPQNGNVYQIQYQWLGFGAITFSVEDENEGDFEPYHIIRYANNNTQPSIFLPTLPILWELDNTTASSAVSMFSASAMAAAEGRIRYDGNKFGALASAAQSGGHLLTIRNKLYYQSKVNIIETVISNISIGNDANTGTTYTLRLNATISAPSYSDVDATNSCIETDVSNSTISAGTILGYYAVAKDNSLNLSFKLGDIILEPGDTLSLTTSNSTTQTASINWVEYE